jgi:amino acid transporter
METASLTNSSSSGSSRSSSRNGHLAPNMSSSSSSYPRGPWTRKPLSMVLEGEEQQNAPLHRERHLTLVDLISVGVGGTIGSGIFVLSGFIANHYAGPATTLSFIISGMAAGCSGLCYAELAGRIPAAGSTYIYAYISLGEWAAVVAAACLTLEYGVSGAAVARSWGDKVVEWLVNQWQWEDAASYLQGEYFHPMAGLISAASVALLVQGVQESKTITNAFTLLKVGLVIFMTVGGFYLMDTDNLTPVMPYGTAGVLRGATSSFFGYLGYDEVCCMAAEAKNPRDMPRAVLWTLAIVTILYVAASLALSGMLPYDQISDTSAFPAAFQSRGILWAAQLSAAGEVITLPVVVLISLMAQPRLFLALAHDGLLPEIFGRADAHGNLWWGNLLSGVPMTLLATFVPFSYLDDLISVGILVAFSMTNTSLILLRCEAPIDKPHWLPNSLAAYHTLAFVTGLSSHWVSDTGTMVRYTCAGIALIFVLWIHKTFPPTGRFGGSVVRRDDGAADLLPTNQGEGFSTPLVPLLPCIGISINWYLIAQLELSGILLLVVYIGLVTILYLFGCRGNRGWNQASHAPEDEYLERDMVLLRELSMPKR